MPMDGVGDDRRNSGGVFPSKFQNWIFILCVVLFLSYLVEEHLLSAKDGYAQFSGNYAPDNVDLARQPINIG